MRYSFVPAVAMLLLASPAIAQDMPATSWNGWYAGLNAGYGFSGTSTQTTGQAAVNNSTVSDGARRFLVRNELTGLVGGGQLGYNWQMGSMFYGVETDIQYAELRDTRTIVTTGTAFPGVRNNTYSYDLDYLGTARVRTGYAWDRSVFYLTGGLAYGGVNKAVSFTGPLPAGVVQFTGAREGTKVGYTAGAGYEHDIGSNLSLKTEFLYYDLGPSTVAANVIAGSGGAGTGYNVRFENKGQVARIGINYRLGW
jgi:outer membrane immunogenic protein